MRFRGLWYDFFHVGFFVRVYGRTGDGTLPGRCAVLVVTIIRLPGWRLVRCPPWWKWLPWWTALLLQSSKLSVLLNETISENVPG